MSLFDDILDDGASGSPDFGPQEGFAGVLLCASACDGHIGDEEGQTINLILGRRKLYERLTQQQFGSMMDRLMGELKRGGPEKLLDKSYPAVPPELRETVFANAIDIVLADGTVEQEEREFIDDLQGKLEVDEKRAKAIVQVMVYKNHG
ncbi:MAG: tellurite resistance TerB family protein [Candidatus Nealsonbacteria bacterium]|nr:tellurite resistance TerB family protein [Candidatus Nealsonbacteria bacterium]